jgi:hypothetical protein
VLGVATPGLGGLTPVGVWTPLGWLTLGLAGLTPVGAWPVLGWVTAGRATVAGLAAAGAALAGAAVAGVAVVVFLLSVGAAISAPLNATASTTPAQNIFSTVVLNFKIASIGVVYLWLR